MPRKGGHDMLKMAQSVVRPVPWMPWAGLSEACPPTDTRSAHVEYEQLSSLGKKGTLPMGPSEEQPKTKALSVIWRWMARQMWHGGSN